MTKCSLSVLFTAHVLAILSTPAAASTGICDNSFVNCPTIETEQQLEGDTADPPWVYTSGYENSGDGGGGVLYGPPPTGSPCNAVAAVNGGSCVKDGNGVLYSAQTFPSNVQQWGADPSGTTPSTTAVQNLATALATTED